MFVVEKEVAEYSLFIGKMKRDRTRLFNSLVGIDLIKSYLITYKK